LLFENRQTLWFRVHEVVRVARLGDPDRLQRQLDWYNHLLPGKDRLQAALLIEIDDETRTTEELTFWQGLRGQDVRPGGGEGLVAGTLVTCRPEDRCIGAAHWVQFHLDRAARAHLADFARPARFEIIHPGYEHQSPPLSDDVRQSLLDDLAL